jgi:ribosomal protein L40E
MSRVLGSATAAGHHGNLVQAEARRSTLQDSPQPVLPTQERSMAPAVAAGPSAAPEQLGQDTEAVMRFCVKCGGRLPDGATFCSACGSRVLDPDGASTRPPARANAPAERRRPSIRMVAGGAVAIGILAVGAIVIALGGAPGTTHTLHGELDLVQQNQTGFSNYTIPSGDNLDCAGLGGYSDIRAGAQIVVKDEGGKVIGSGSLGRGHLSIDFTNIAGPICAFSFEVSGLPKAAQYQIGSGSRGSITYSFESQTWSGCL